MSAFLRWHDTRVDIQNFNNDFLLLRSTDSSKIAQIGAAIFQHNFDFIEEVIVTETEICLKLNATFHPTKIGLLMDIRLEKQLTPIVHQLPVYFNQQEDWRLIEDFTALNRQTIIQQLTTIPFSVAMFGFLPGFTYFKGLPSHLHLPRKAVPATYIEANSLAIGGKYLGIYSIASPGGWYVIGQVPIPILQLPKLPPVSLHLGDQIQLQAISRASYEALVAQNNADV